MQTLLADPRPIIGGAILIVGLIPWLVLPKRRPIPYRQEPSNAVSDEWSSRKTIFTPGAHYRVKQCFDACIQGDKLIFKLAGYVAYDNSHYYLFAVGGGERTWSLHDNEPRDRWKQYFEPVAG